MNDLTDTGIAVPDPGAAPAPTSSTYTLSTMVGLLNIVAGLMIVAAFLLFFGGLSAYFSRLGMASRDSAIHYMQWGVTVLFVLVVMLGLIGYVQNHQQIVLLLVAVVVVIFGGWAVFQAIQESGAEDHDE